MKIIRCEACGDAVALSLRWRVCHCGESGGRYKSDHLRAFVSGPCRVFGISNRVFYDGRAEAWEYDESNGRIDRVQVNPGDGG